MWRSQFGTVISVARRRSLPTGAPNAAIFSATDIVSQSSMTVWLDGSLL